MTVCTASAFFWTYSGDGADIGCAIVAASDRKLTDSGLGIGYESSRWKGAHFNGKQLALVAGEMSVHSEIIKRLNVELEATALGTTFDTAERAARIFKRYRTQEAANKYLAPINLDENTFLTQQRSMDPNLVIELTRQMQNYEIETEILILGCEGNASHMYRIDSFGNITNHSDIGFVSIGSGGIHSSAHFMLLPYNYLTTYFPALYQTFKAKKRAEAEPYVGEHTDMFVMTREGISQVDHRLVTVLESLHKEDLEITRQRPEESEKKISAELVELLASQPIAPPTPPAEASRD